MAATTNHWGKRAQKTEKQDRRAQKTEDTCEGVIVVSLLRHLARSRSEVTVSTDSGNIAFNDGWLAS